MVVTGHRQLDRDSLFLMAEVRLDGVEGEHRVRVRNLSAGGMMADGDVQAKRGQLCQIKLRNMGWTEASVAWVQENRFGVAFREEIDPKVAREPVAAGVHTPRFVRPPLGEVETGHLRKL